MPAKRTTTKKHMPVEATKHRDKRKNIPTEELSDFVKSDEKAPTKLGYPRDPSLDPQLVWKGKDEQDAENLEVPAVPIYIQEKIHPKALVENLRRTAERESDEPEMMLFDDFNGLEFEQEIDFYQHEHNWSNRMILGDSLMVMASLAEKEGLKRKVQMIYIDPPYGIKFGSNWQVSTRKRDVKDSRVEDMTRQPEQVKAFRDTWELGIHSYLAYLRDRLVAARDLLTESGSVFVQIGDENIHLVRSLLDEIFGSENFVSLITTKKTTGLGTDYLKGVADYILWYARDRKLLKFRPLFRRKAPGQEGGTTFQFVELPDGTRRKMRSDEIENPESLPQGARLWAIGDLSSSGATISCIYPYEIDGKVYNPTAGKSWKTTRDGMDRLLQAQRILISPRSISYIRYLDDFPVFEIDNIWGDVASSFMPDRVYVVQTSTKIVERCLLMSTDPGDLVLDPTCGSGTTSVVAEQRARRWITIDTSRVALALARTRLMTARYPYYLLADSAEGLKKQMETDGKVPDEVPQTNEDVRKGFVYKTVPHVTLKSIANNPDIKRGMSREEIDTAIARHADKEVLYDQPYEDNNRVRVTGPFTVESLSPHRVLSPDEERPVSEFMEKIDYDAGQFEQSIIENLKKAGVQNMIRDERLVFDILEPYAGRYIQAAGDFTDKDGKVRRVGVSIGPEHATVGKDQLREAAKEARRGEGFDMLVVCGFAFDPAVPEAAKEYGELTVLPTRMNPDLTMGDELLKKTGSGNLFMVFGEPDLDVQEEDGHVTVEIRGLDIYDPTTGEIRSSSTDDIACWSIDTNYNSESFFVRHAYFTGADKPYEKLRRVLKAQIDESAWESLYSTKSRPFVKPDTGRFAVKVINHYGDEVLKVYEL